MKVLPLTPPAGREGTTPTLLMTTALLFGEGGGGGEGKGLHGFVIFILCFKGYVLMFGVSLYVWMPISFVGVWYSDGHNKLTLIVGLYFKL